MRPLRPRKPLLHRKIPQCRWSHVSIVRSDRTEAREPSLLVSELDPCRQRRDNEDRMPTASKAEGGLFLAVPASISPWILRWSLPRAERAGGVGGPPEDLAMCLYIGCDHSVATRRPRARSEAERCRSQFTWIFSVANVAHHYGSGPDHFATPHMFIIQ